MSSFTENSPVGLIRDVKNEINYLFDQKIFPILSLSTSTTRHWSPQVDLKEEEDKFVITADLPGMDPKDVHIVMDNHALILEGERNVERHLKEENYYRTERYSGKFYRRFMLPEYVDSEHISAKFKRGILEVIIPKKEGNRLKKMTINIEEEA